MAWVRYDDNFDHHRKVTAAILIDPGSMSLHLLANTWTSSTEVPGYVPRHQPGALMVDRAIGSKWAEIMVSVKLWHDVNNMCDRCAQSYAGLPTDADGYVFHDHEAYRPPARERQTPGTPSEISAKRQAAGRRGGKATAARRAQIEQDVANQANELANQANDQQNPPPAPVDEESVTSVDRTAADGLFDTPKSADIKQPVRAKAANGASKASKQTANRVSPVPEGIEVASNEATLTTPVASLPTSPPLSITKRSKRITDAYYDKVPLCNWSGVNQLVIRAIKTETWTDEQIETALMNLAEVDRPVTADSLRIELNGTRNRPGGHQSFRDDPNRDFHGEL